MPRMNQSIENRVAIAELVYPICLLACLILPIKA